ncbi:DEAD/DEAH box helicase [Mesorhizobium japonicum]|uniref:DEAD/DEAH box helicase n=1 Tax=Mesorhizobium japonicum TaxID=2066070 RepID=UPI003B5914C3
MTDLPDPPRPIFPQVPRQQPLAADPETLFGELPRRRDGVGALWSHQVDQLRTYRQGHLEAPDVALELPTGSGKTLVGLLIAEWRRRSRQQRVVYACPTRQLALQVVAAGERQGIELYALIDSNHDWDARQLSAYTRAQAIAVTTYSHIFNTNSHLGDARTVIFDDAHAAEGYVADAWALEIKSQHPAYGLLFDAMAPALDPQLVSRMTGHGEDAATWPEVRLVPISAVQARLTDVDTVLGTALQRGSSEAYRFQMLRENLASCLFYVSRGSWYIRPMIPPTFSHAPYVDPEQRVYLSATLGEAGELERAFGRTTIARIPSPPAWERTGSGRRFFVFPDLGQFDPTTDTVAVPPATPGELDGLAELDQPDLLNRMAGLAEKRLILTQRDATAKRIADNLGVPADQRYEASDRTVDTFKAAPRGTLLAANRYDGMDLADESCRFMIMAEVPKASHLQDRFLSSKLRASEVLAERIRTRIVQGAGRCTRGPQDWAVVVVSGGELLRYFSDPENTRSMPVELQAEIEFGLAASDSSYSNTIALTLSGLVQDEEWRTQAEPMLADGRARAVRSPQPLSAELQASAPREVAAWREAWIGDWEAAGRAAVEVLEGLTASGSRSYRALWAYFASAWFARAAADGIPGARERSAELLRTAHAAAVGGVWLREIQTLPAADVTPDATDESAIARTLALRDGPFRSAATFQRRAQTMLERLAQDEATSYEQGLVELGTMLGAKSYKPDGQGKTDAAWLWDDLWLTVEAKSEQTAHRLTIDYVRKANTHLASLADDEGCEEPPTGSASVIVGTTRLIDPGAIPIANANLHLTTTEVVLELAHDVHRAWTEIREAVPLGGGTEAAGAVSRILWTHRALPSQVKERLTAEPIRGL